MQQTQQKCNRCGSDRIVKSGFKITTKGKFQLFMCCVCGHKFREGNNNE